MARCFEAKKSRAGKTIKCGRCGVTVQPGEQYFYFSVGFRGAKQIRCKNHLPKPSELCGSKMSSAYAANEALADLLNTPNVSVSDIASALETAAGEIEQVRDEYQESFDSLPQNFQDGEQGSTMQENIDGLDEYASALSNAQSEVEALEPESSEPSGEGDEPEQDDDLLTQAKELAENAMQEFSL